MLAENPPAALGGVHRLARLQHERFTVRDLDALGVAVDGLRLARVDAEAVLPEDLDLAHRDRPAEQAGQLGLDLVV